MHGLEEVHHRVVEEIVAIAGNHVPGAGHVDHLRVRNELFTLGAPLYGKVVSIDETEAALARGAALAHRDATAARVLPLCFFKNRNTIEVARLKKRATEVGEAQAVGFFLELTAMLSGDPRLRRWSAAFRDRRRTGHHYFFRSDQRSTLAREAARKNTPDVASRWGFWMNLKLDGFASMFEKFQEEARE